MSKQMTRCNCKDTYTIEEHGYAYALYYGKCNHRHGYYLAKISDIAYNCDLKKIERLLNGIPEPEGE